MTLQEKPTRGEKVQKNLIIMRNLSTESIKACWKKVPEQTQENFYFSVEKLSQDEVEYIGEIENKEDHLDPDIWIQFPKNNISSISVLLVLNFNLLLIRYC